MMAALPYSLVIEATKEPVFFTFYSPDLAGFSGVGHSIEDCVYKAKWEMLESIDLLKDQGLPVALKNPDPQIVIQNDKSLVSA
jgi:hypothetical protein